MEIKQLSGGLVHNLPLDLAQALINNPKAFVAWESISIKARNEWICWIISVKQEKTRKLHIERARTELANGKRRPCCWVGCMHRTDKPISPWVRAFLTKK